ncbi:MAG TPA: DUF3105 domain-containing protein [Acidimicrobiales bacterium]|nr:DUF3105 domain-containing protein [Acidimicrobiales bacterium]
MRRWLVVAALLALGACGGSDDTTGGTAVPATDVVREGCGVVVEEALDPQTGRHLLPGAAEPTYPSDPPTSGPHPSGGAPPTGIVAAPIPRPLQVQLLEKGGAVIQYRDLGQADVARLRTLAAPTVAVAPGPPDLPAPIVATAWVHKQLCEAVDTDALAAFVRNQAKQPEGAPPHP